MLSEARCEDLGYTGLALCSDCDSLAEYVKDKGAGALPFRLVWICLRSNPEPRPSQGGRSLGVSNFQTLTTNLLWLSFPGTSEGVDCRRGDRLFDLGTVAAIQSWIHISVMAGCALLEGGGAAGAF